MTYSEKMITYNPCSSLETLSSNTVPAVPDCPDLGSRRPSATNSKSTTFVPSLFNLGPIVCQEQGKYSFTMYPGVKEQSIKVPSRGTESLHFF